MIVAVFSIAAECIQHIFKFKKYNLKMRAYVGKDNQEGKNISGSKK